MQIFNNYLILCIYIFSIAREFLQVHVELKLKPFIFHQLTQQGQSFENLILMSKQVPLYSKQIYIYPYTKR